MTSEQWNNPKLRAKELLRVARKAKNELEGKNQVRGELYLNLGKLIREKRLSKSLTAKKLADLSGLTFSHIYKIEAGKLNCNLSTLEKLAKAMDLRLEINLIRPKAPSGTDLET